MRQSTRLIELKNKARREGWLKYLRQGLGQEADERALLNGCWFSEHRANHFLEFVDRYALLTEGGWKDKPFVLTDWERVSASRVFGWQRESKEWGQPVRRFRYWYTEIPKKNGKTPFGALVGNYLLFADSFGRQINLYLAATTRKQAERCLMHAIRQIRANDTLDEAAKIKKLEGFHQIEYNDSVWQVIAADPDSADGVNGHCIADEIHRWKGMEFFNTLRWMLAGQPEGLFVAITTAGNTKDGICWTLHEKTEAINAGRQIDEPFYGEIYAAESDDDPHDEKIWSKANPSLGDTPTAPLKLSTFRQDYETAKLDPLQWPAWQQFRLNIWRSAESAWFPIKWWDAGAVKRKKQKKRIDCFEQFSLDDLEGRECYCAFDGAAVRDTTAAVFAFPEGDEIIKILPWFWLPRNRAIQLQDRVPFEQWESEGLITLTEGDAVDFRQVMNDMINIFARLKVQRFYFDPLFQAEWLTREISDASGVERVEYPQRITFFAAPTAGIERLIYSRKMRHNGHKLMTWQLGHCNVCEDANNNKRPIKPKHGDHRTIDGVVAMIMACRDLIAGKDTGSFYDEHDLELV